MRISRRSDVHSSDERRARAVSYSRTHTHHNPSADRVAHTDRRGHSPAAPHHHTHTRNDPSADRVARPGAHSYARCVSRSVCDSTA